MLPVPDIFRRQRAERMHSFVSAKFHQDGTERMPSRPIFGVGARDVPALQQVLDDWVFGEARGLGVS